MLDTISFYRPIEAPEAFYQQVPHPIQLGKFTLYPEYRNGFVKSYYCNLQNLKVQLTTNKAPILKITNSLHKYYKGNNYSDFPFSEIKEAIFLLSEDLSLPIFNYKITRLDYGLNLPLDAQKIYPFFKSYKGRAFDKMKGRTFTYGKKVFLSQAAIKGYNKTVENNKNKTSMEKLKTNVFRFEVEVNNIAHFHRRAKPVPISMVKDLLEEKNYLLLKEDLLKKYDQIKKEVFIDLDQLSIGDIKTLAVMEKELYKQAIQANFPDSYKKCRATERRIYRNTQNTFFTQELRGKMVQKLDELIQG